MLTTIKPTDLFIDFETFCEIDIRKTSTWRYASHESTDVICLAYAIGNGPVKLWTPGDKLPGWFKKIDQYTIHAHNATFESLMWSLCCVPKFGWPEVLPEQWSCTAAKCAALALPRSLDKAAKALGLEVQKDNTGKNAMLRACKPNSKGERITREAKPELFDIIYRYCENDVLVEREIYKATYPIWDREQHVWLCDQQINTRGIPIDIESVESAIDILEQYEQRETKRLIELTAGAVTTASQVSRMVEWLNLMGVNTDNVKAATITELLEGDLEENVRDVLRIRQNLSKASNKKLVAMREWSTEGRVRFSHMYHGATTGRWAGRGVQFQNVPRGNLKPDQVEHAIDLMRGFRCAEFLETIYGDVTSTVSSCLRGMVKAPEGKKLIVCDFAAIEARVLAWLANDARLLVAFREGTDPYKEMASTLYGVDVDAVTSDQRFIGKICVLGLGYGMGAKTFAETCKAWGAGEIEPEFAQHAVDTYRERHRPIWSLWKDCNYGAMEAILSNRPQKVRRVEYRVKGDWLFATLPWGRQLAYYDPRVEDVIASWGDKVPAVTFMGENLNRHWVRQDTYGGKLVENLVQAVARDLLVAAMGRLERYGYQIVMHVHDELVIEADESAELAEVEELMIQIPTWAEGCPVAAEGFEARRYRK